ncbi:hypothetical protein JYU34_021318 [Plutella xylostella]|uniref:PHD-type domain-containing protein n=1 Tax=Plutella xylostella TaxID=51655 RepID=A0ABQ7PTA5_PLUXY|nr:hypothetical protein JYU34_021318 [Plutella xylostella]
MAKCAACTTLVTKKKPGLQCSKCKKWLHGTCAAISTDQLNALFLTESVEWMCKACTGKARPARLSCILPDAEEDEGVTDTEDASADKMTKVSLTNIKREIQLTIRDEVKREIQAVFREEMQRTMQYLSDKIDDYEKCQKESKERISNLEKNVHNLTNTCVHLQKYNGALEQKIMDMEQSTRKLNLEIVGIEVLPDENPKIIIEKLGDLMKVSFKEIESATRGAPRSNAKPAPITVKFSSSGAAARDAWLKQRRAARAVTSDMLTGGSQTSAVYVNEDLIPETRELFWRTRAELRDVCKYIWLSDGKVLVKQTDGAKASRIKCVNDIGDIKKVIVNK